MASLNETGMGIGDFALNLLEREEANPQPASKPKTQGNVPDIENVQVLQEDVNQVLENSFGIKSEEKPKINLQEERKKVLKEEIKQKVSELKDLLNEFYGPGTTTTGSIGTTNVTNRPNTRRVRARRRKEK